MRKIYKRTVNNPIKIIVIFVILAVIGAVCKNFAAVNYEMADYLPADSSSTVSLDLMKSEFDGGIPNARVMVKNVSVAEALEYKDKLKNTEGVESVIRLDDSINIYAPIETADKDTVETYYKNNNALFTVTIDEDDDIATVQRIRELIGDDNAMSGNAVSSGIAKTGTVNEINLISVFAVLAVLIILILTTSSFAEPFIVLIGLGVAIMINSGSNLIFGEISFVTNAAGAILQLAVSLDYSVFLLHRYEECLKTNPDKKEAMIDALCLSTSSIASSGLDIDLLQSSNKATIESLSAQIRALQQNIAAMKQAGMDTTELEQTATQLAGIVQLLQGNSAAISGTDAYLSQLYVAAGQLSDGVKQLSKSYAELDAGINELADKVGSMLTSLAEMKSGIETLVAEYTKLDSGINEYTGAVAQITAGYEEVVNGTKSLLSGSNTLADGTSQLADKTEELKSGVSEIYTATGTLSDGAKSLSDGANELGDACSEFHSGALKLKDGTSELRSETDGMNNKISDKIDEIPDSITGGDEAIVSFTSDKNTDIDSVQFVIKTEAIEIPEAPDEESAAEKELNFWQKVLRLFGLY